MIPKIRKLDKTCPWWNGHRWVEEEWMVGTKENGYDYCETFGDAVRYWLWHCGVSPKIAFGWFKKK